ncbi:lish domain-containing protein fopnl [Plakobranchus ocellatus]|uniref:Centrosomal protein 20 n=1 Tax=Plakobranchus ocellatus TaxID=259542 RepID=A0AAV3Y5H0_9GAST|nr:lish domain-containing protein fopnl [Plakobranchus ocellatus]
MASRQDLKEVLKESLENRGALSEIKARIRAEVFSALDDQAEPKPQISNENVLIFELIREFLDYNLCKYTSTVLVSETGLPKAPLDREFLRNELNIVEDAPSKSVPLLYSLVSNYKDSNASRQAGGLTFQANGSKNQNFTKFKGDESPNPEAVIVKGGRL